MGLKSEKLVTILQAVHSAAVEMLQNEGFAVEVLAEQTDELVKTAFANSDGIIVRNMQLTREHIAASTHCRILARHGAGIENIDIEAATECGVQVTNTPDANSVTVAEHTMGLIIALSKNIVRVHNEHRSGNFNIRNTLYGCDLAGKALGIIGCGRIGRRLAAMAARGFGMNVLGYDPHAGNFADARDLQIVQSLDELLSMSDFVSLHAPSTDETRGIIDSRALSVMKKGAFLVNCARAALIDEEAVAEALGNGHLAGAAIDVYNSEPPSADWPFFSMPNVICTPHSAAHTEQAMVRMAAHAAQGVIEILSGRTPTWPVNKIRE
jgi:D-3-phosphoglycerate dehydrogenase